MWRDAGRGRDGPRGVARLVGESLPMRELKALIPRVATSPFPVVIEGESGTGKELIARAIHEEGPRRGAVFVPVNCAVLGDELFESELFGHARGAFTGASQDRKGLLELSSGGTVFLDEVAELTPRAQAKLLRVLQDGEIRRLGENRTQRLDLRVVAATNRPLGERRRPGASARTCSTASASSNWRPRRCASAGRTWPGSRTTTGRTSPRRPAAARPWRGIRWPPWRRTRGPATSGNCRTCSPT